MGYFPDPMLDISKEHQDFEDIFKKETTERDRPSLRFSLDVTEADKSNKSLLVAAKVSATIIFHYVQNRGMFTPIQNLQKPSH